MAMTLISINVEIGYGGKLPSVGDSINATVHKPTPFYIEGTVHAIKRLKWTTGGKLRVTVVVDTAKLNSINNLLVIK